MSIEAIAALTSATSALPIANTPAATMPSELAHAGVFDSLVQQIGSLNTQMSANQQAVESLATGQTDQLHRVIMNMESTKLNFDLMLQVRNKVLDAYQELMRMQV